MNWHAQEIDLIVAQLNTDPEKGLSGSEARDRLKRYGLNQLAEKKRRTLIVAFLDQFRSILVMILIAAAVISAILGEFIDSVVICSIVIINAVLGLIQERRAEKALDALKRLSSPEATVIRNGEQITIPTREIVPGDVVILQAGDKVAADMRLIESVNLKIDESALTGESVPVEKDTSVTSEENLYVGDRHNMAHAGTVVTYGRGKGVVVATGVSTEVGKIAEMIESVEEEQTPLQAKLDQLGRWLSLGALGLCASIFLVGALRGERLIEMFMTSISLAVAAIPEGLPAIVTIALALGVKRMVARNAIIRRLPAVETLGSATVICTDKTGTLTQNKMQVIRIARLGSDISVTGEGYVPEGEFRSSSDQKIERLDDSTRLFLEIGLLCNDSSIRRNGEEWEIQGDPTEVALVVVAAKAGLDQNEIRKERPRVAEIPFDSDRKLMTTIHAVEPKSHVAYVKGAPDMLIERCDRVMRDGEIAPMSEADRNEILDWVEQMSISGLRVLAGAYKPIDSVPDHPNPEEIETGLIFVGLWGMIDPPRSEAHDAVSKCRRAGIKPVMITGDSPSTAQAIASEIGILTADARVLTGEELNTIDDEELASLAGDVSVYARVSPEHKMRIIDALQGRGNIVAMTGDGVNDAPALKKADIGVAMGITGTDVAKETADMVLTDDNFASIVSAVEEGRAIFDNIRKFTSYLVSCNLGEILIVFVPVMLGMGRPLEPVQILWVNLLTDGLPALALGVEKAEKDIMERPPRNPKEGVFTKGRLIASSLVSLVIAISALSAYFLALRFWGDAAQTMTFCTLMLSEIWRALSSRSFSRTVFETGIFSNRNMNWAVLTSLLLLAAIMFFPPLHPVFKTQYLTRSQWGVVFGFSLIPSFSVEMSKLIARLLGRRKRNQEGKSR